MRCHCGSVRARVSQYRLSWDQPIQGHAACKMASTITLLRKRHEDHGSEWLLTAPARRAVFVERTRSEVRERSSMEAVLLELLAAPTWAGVVPPDPLERVNKRLEHVGKGQTNILRSKG